MKKKRKINFVNKACIIENISLREMQRKANKTVVEEDSSYDLNKCNELGTRQYCGIHCTLYKV